MSAKRMLAGTYERWEDAESWESTRMGTPALGERSDEHECQENVHTFSNLLSLTFSNILQPSLTFKHIQKHPKTWKNSQNIKTKITNVKESEEK